MRGQIDDLQPSMPERKPTLSGDPDTGIIRSAVCERLGWLGLRLDPAANAAGPGCISAKDSAIEVRVIATDEEAMIAHHTLAVLATPG